MPSRPTSTSASWMSVKRLYEQAVELSGAQRQVFLAEAEVDESVRAEVRSLLAYDPDQAGQQNARFLRDRKSHV